MVSEQTKHHPGQLVANGGRRLAVQASEWLDNWYVAYSPRNDNNNAEGPWEDWVTLAHDILRIDAEARKE